DFSVISKNSNNTNKLNNNISLVAANGTKINTHGTKLIMVNLGLRRKFNFPFLIADVDRPIVGADFLSEFGLLVDLKGKKLIDRNTGLCVNAISQISNSPSPKHYSINNEYGTLLKKFPALTAQPNYNLPVQHNVVHHILTTGQLPVSRPRRLDLFGSKSLKTSLNTWSN
ncbi:MAG TPA: hypothetical protein DDZ41_11455, partial [Flavobacterium sp.]|nr:hypothetical protein [Flavobacterium sp.]